MTGLIAQDWVEPYGGAEIVLSALAANLPPADLACLWNDDPRWSSTLRVRESWLAGSPLRGRKALTLPLMAGTWRRNWRELQPDWLVTSSYVFAHHLGNVFPEVPRYHYVHSPARYLWASEFDQRGSNPLLTPASAILRRVDRRAAQQSGNLAANSEFIRTRIQRAWGRDAKVIYPPVDVSGISAEPSWADKLTPPEADQLAALPRGDFLLAGSRMVPYKGHSRVIEMGEALKIPVVLTGSGPEEPRLRAQAQAARTPVHFFGHVSREMLYALYERALAFVFPPVEDFGIMPVEAMAVGCPVVGNRVGGASETIVDNVSGALFDPADSAAWATAIDRAAGTDRSAVRSHAKNFDADRFSASFRAWASPDISFGQGPATGAQHRESPH